MSWRWAMVVAGVAGCVTIQEQGGNPCDPDPCTSGKGVCAVPGWTGECSVDATGNRAVCTWAWTGKAADRPKDAAGKALAKPVGYALADVTCDGKDNDCDGLVDEEVNAVALACPVTSGVCAGVDPAKVGKLCMGGAVQCNFAAVPGWQAIETSCDGLDNDCDGQTDEDAVAKSSDCLREGVCHALPAPTCEAGKWNCRYADAADYEVAETKCDGKDNDCDGLVDANLKVQGLNCLAKGVCASGVQQACKGGEPVCLYKDVTGFQAVETACDGVDNDCDGTTDNAAATNLPLTATDTAGCETQKGVCGQFKTKVAKLCTAGKMQCSYDAVPSWEVVESTCDGKDNDCDGTIDGDKLPKPGCGGKGVCAAAQATCDDGFFTCNFGSIAGFEPSEESCDGLDNDCDGETDEFVSPAKAGCKGLGACAWGTVATCAGKKASCDYSHVAGYQDVTETVCDGVDNDCDGQTDEADGLNVSASGCAVGVCAGKANPTCSGGKWTCSVAGVLGYEAKEKSCDGLDNDCNGATDDNLTDTAAAKCPTAGVCAAGVQALCMGGKWFCNKDAIVGYEPVEVSCDGLDNDCDGKTDPGVCVAGANCKTDGQCASNNCTDLNDGSGSVCTEKTTQCASLAAGKAVFTDDGAGLCVTGSSLISCSKGTWTTATACGGATPVCSGGKCVLCTPDALACDPNDKSKVIKCSADGLSSTPEAPCGSGSHCAGNGACVPDGVIALSDTAAAESPVGIALTNGGFAVLWINASSTDVRLRLFGSDGKPTGPSTVFALKAKPLTRLAVAAAGAGSAVVWLSTVGVGSTEVDAQLLDGAGAKLGKQVVVSISTTNGEPAVAGNAQGFWVSWTSKSVEESQSDKGVALQRYDLAGAPVGDAIVATLGDFKGADSTFGDQSNPAIAVNAAGQTIVAWQSALAPKGVYAQAFNADGSSASPITTLALTGDVPSLIWSGTEAVLATVVSNASGGQLQDIQVRHFDIQMAALGPLQLANSFTTGNQNQPTLALGTSGGFLLGWTSDKAVSSASGLDICSRDVAPVTGFSGSELVLNKATPTGDQDQPFIVPFTDGRVLHLWRSKATSGGGAIEGIFR